MPLITSLGLLIYAIFPMVFSNLAYVGLLFGTVIFSVAADLQCTRTKEGKEFECSRSRIVVAARAAGIEVYDTPFTNVNFHTDSGGHAKLSMIIAPMFRARLSIIDIMELKEKTERITVKPQKFPKGDRIVANVIGRNGNLLGKYIMSCKGLYKRRNYERNRCFNNH